MSRPRKFATVTIRGEGRDVRGYRVECKGCGKSESLPFNSVKNGSNDGEKESKLIARKFEAKGWKIGKNASQDVCLKCATVGNETHHDEELQPAKPAKEKTPMPAHATDPAARPPREMSPDDALAIIGTMQEVYLGADKGYGEGWTDSKVADSLNVPRAWVRQVRLRFYGENARGGNDEIAEIVRDAEVVLEQAREVVKTLEGTKVALNKRVDEKLAPVLRQLERVERALASADKSLR